MGLATRRAGLKPISPSWLDDLSFWDTTDIVEPERSLWRAYFVRKYNDALGFIIWDDDPKVIRQAREWFKGRPCHGITWEWVAEAIRIADHEKLAIEALIFSSDIKGF